MKQSMSRYLKKYKGLFIINLIVMFIVEFLVRLVAIAMQIIIDTAVYGNFAGMTIIARYIILYMISIVVFAHTELVLNHKLMRKVLKDLKNDLMNGFYNISMMGFRGENSGKYISMMNNDVVEVEREYFGKMLSIFSSVFVIVIALSILFTISPLLLVIQMILSIPPLVFPLFFSKKLTKRKDSQMDALSKYNIRIKDLLSGFEVIKSYKKEDKAKEIHEQVNEDVESKKYKFLYLKALIDPVTANLAVILQFTVYITAGFLVISSDLTVGQMSASLALSATTVPHIHRIINSITAFKATKTITSRLLDFIDTEKKDFKQYDNGLTKAIELKNVSFFYEENKPTLKNINIKIEKGKKYAIVGPSGSGKSTLVKLILKYFDTYEGDILIDDINIKEIDTTSMFAITHQDVFIFNDTISNNISLFSGSNNDEEINEILNKLGLSPLIDSMENGIHTILKENGNNLSGGEKQRISIARALFAKKSVLVFDEAMANLDNNIALEIEKNLREIPNLTCISITHRLNKEVMEMYDEIFVLKDGVVCESGTFDNLLKQKGLLYEMYMNN